MSSSVRRAFVVAAAATGLLAAGAGSASADEVPVGRAVAGAADTVTDATHIARRSTLDEAERIAQYEAETGNKARRSSGKAIRDVTQKAGEAVSENQPAPSNEDLAAVSRVPAQAAPSSAPGLPEDLVIEVPELVPGVPSIGIVPLSLPALPVTPTVPFP